MKTPLPPHLSPIEGAVQDHDRFLDVEEGMILFTALVNNEPVARGGLPVEDFLEHMGNAALVTRNVAAFRNGEGTDPVQYAVSALLSAYDDAEAYEFASLRGQKVLCLCALTIMDSVRPDVTKLVQAGVAHILLGIATDPSNEAGQITGVTLRLGGAWAMDGGAGGTA